MNKWHASHDEYGSGAVDIYLQKGTDRARVSCTRPFLPSQMKTQHSTGISTN